MTITRLTDDVGRLAVRHILQLDPVTKVDQLIA
jgi:hypothetical protein